MREIKFRAWDRQKTEMVHGVWVNQHSVCTDGTQFLSDDIMVPMQFTGLKDKNGKEIYEGDICKYWMDGRWKVGGIGWYRGGWAIHVKKYGDEPMDVIFEFQTFIPTPEQGQKQVMGDQFEIIGNIYEDPNCSRTYE